MAEIITTGGTFDKLLRDPDDEDEYDFPSVTHVFDAFRRHSRDVRPHFVRSLLWLDSRDMNEEEFQKIADACAASRESQVIVVHGTDKMVESAKVTKRHPDLDPSKSVVFTGAIKAFSVNPAHATYNLFHALEVSEQVSGVHIAMNAEVFDPDNVRKNYGTMMFEHIVSLDD